MQCVHARELRIDHAPLSAYLAACTQPFSPSALYSTALEASLIDEGLRRSKFRDIRDPALFALCEDAVREANRSDPSSNYLLLRNTATHIVYEEGDFFQRHTDFLSLTSNVIQEFTMIIGLAPPPSHPQQLDSEGRTCEGGETALNINAETQHLSTVTSTPGGCLVFRKDLSHEGKVIRSGVKHILTLNLWAVAKQDHPYSHQILHVTFKAPEGAQGPAADQPPALKRLKPQSAGGSSISTAELASVQATQASLLHQTAAAQSYAIACSKLFPSCLLARFVAFSVKQHLGSPAPAGPPPAVVHYECDNATYSAFGTIYRAINRMHLTREEVQEQAVLLDYHQIPTHFCLIDEANQGFKDPAGPVTRSRSRASATAGRPRASPADANDEHIIICATQERAQLVSDLAKRHHLPYVSFQMLFCEGEIIYNDDDGGVENEAALLPMTPVFVSFGDYQNVYLIRRVMARDGCLAATDSFERFDFDRFLDATHKQHSLDLLSNPDTDVSFGWIRSDGSIRTGAGYRSRSTPPPLLSHTVILSDDDPEPSGSDAELEDAEDAIAISDEQTVFWGLRAAYSAPPRTAKPGSKPPLGLCEGPDDKKDWTTGAPLSSNQVPGSVIGVVLYGKVDPLFPDMRPFPGCGKAGAAAHDLPASPPVSSCFHLDKHGNSCFTPEEAKAACTRIRELGLLAKVKAKIASTDFRLPQESQKVASFFCNDERYGNLSVVLVSGLCCMP